MIMAIAELRYYSEDEYLALEEVAEFKHEYYMGQIFDMAGGTPPHSLVATNAAGELRSLVKGGECNVYNSDLRIRVPATGLNTYPDVTIVCGEAELTNQRPPAATNP